MRVWARCLLIATLAAAFAATGCGGDEEATPPGGEPPPATATTGEEAGPTTTAAAPTQATEGKTCEPPEEAPAGDTPGGGRQGGKYRTSVFQPAFTIDFGKRYFSSLPATCDFVNFRDVDVLADTYVPGLLSVVNDTAVRADPAVEIQQTRMPPPDPAAGDVDLATWLHQHPRLKTTEEQPVTVAGLKGTQFDAEVDPTKAYESPACGEGLRCVVVLGLRDGRSAYYLPVENRSRLIALDVDGEQVLLLLEASKADFDDWTKKAEKILSTLSFQPGG